MSTGRISTKIRLVDYLFLVHPSLFGRMGENPYWKIKRLSET